jgi:hypothetical protein
LDVDAAAGVPEATFVPRQPGVKDGPWSKIDDKLVVAAQKEAANAVGRTVLDAAGEDLLRMFMMMGLLDEFNPYQKICTSSCTSFHLWRLCCRTQP